MEPATGPAVTVDAAVAALDALGSRRRRDAPRRRRARRACTRPGPACRTRRAVGHGCGAACSTRSSPVTRRSRRSALGATASPGRIVGPPADARRRGHPSRQRALPRRGADAPRRFAGPRPAVERSRRRPVRGGRAARARRAGAPPAARPHARARAHRHRARPPPELARDHVAQLAPPRESPTSRSARPTARAPSPAARRACRHPTSGASRSSSGTAGRGRRARAARCGAAPRHRRDATVAAPLRRRRSATWWSTQGTRGALDRAAQWRAAVALGPRRPPTTRLVNHARREPERRAAGWRCSR